MCGDYPSSRAHHEEALSRARVLGDRAGEAEALLGLSYALTFSGDAMRGRALAERSLAILRDLGDDRALADALVGIAGTLTPMGESGPAVALASEALARFRGLGAAGRMADALWILGIAEYFRGNLAAATAHHEEHLALRLAQGNEHGAIQPLTALAAIALMRESYVDARRLFDESLRLLDRYDDPWGRAMALVFLGHVELAEGDPERAAAVFVEAGQLFQAIENPLYVPWCLEGLAGVAARRGDWRLAAGLCGLRDALRERLSLGMRPANPREFERLLAGCRAALGEADYAAAHAAGTMRSIEAALAEAGVSSPASANAPSLRAQAR